MKKIHVVMFTVSALFNLAFLSAMFFTARDKPQAIRFSDFEKATGLSGDTAACIIQAPRQNAAVSFGTAEITLKAGDACCLQYSFFRDGSQLNISPDPLYDHEIVSVEKSGYGMIIRAVSPGQCLLQAVSADGIKNIAVVTVTE